MAVQEIRDKAPLLAFETSYGVGAIRLTRGAEAGLYSLTDGSDVGIVFSDKEVDELIEMIQRRKELA